MQLAADRLGIDDLLNCPASFMGVIIRKAKPWSGVAARRMSQRALPPSSRETTRQHARVRGGNCSCAPLWQREMKPQIIGGNEQSNAMEGKINSYQPRVGPAACQHEPVYLPEAVFDSLYHFRSRTCLRFASLVRSK
jgi:hypothetical protein